MQKKKQFKKNLKKWTLKKNLRYDKKKKKFKKLTISESVSVSYHDHISY